MEKKRYQVFVSSTFQDLQEERQEVMQALLELDCIPAGMELFPAADEDQWTLIKDIIDDCDYYLVIVAGRYGSIGPQGQSYTEMEYRYALKKGKPVLAFLHRNPEDLPATKIERDPEINTRLEDFRFLLRKKICKFWRNSPELGGLVSRSLIRLIKYFPATGWVKADKVASEEQFREMLELRKRLEELEIKVENSVVGANSVGLARAVDRQSDFGKDGDWLDLLSSAVERVDLMGRTLYGWTQSKAAAELILQKIRDDQVSFRWLLMASDNQLLPFLEESRVMEKSIRTLEIGKELRTKLETINTLLSDIKDALPEEYLDLLQIRYFKRVPLYFSYMRIDDRFYITHYMCSANSGDSPMLCLKDRHAQWPKAYAQEFETLWRLSAKKEA